MRLISFQMYFNLHAKIAIHILAQKFNDLRIFLARFARYVVKLDFLGFFFPNCVVSRALDNFCHLIQYLLLQYHGQEFCM